MRPRTQPSPRGGFTLIELLIVIGILAMLAALTMAGIGRVRAGQHKATTEATVKKIQTTLNQQLTTSVEKPSNEHLNLVQTYCDGDLERAKSFIAYAYTKRDFPQVFVETVYPPSVGGVGLSRHNAFKQIPNTPSGLSADQESAILLYMGVTGKGSKGTGTTDDAFAGATSTIGNYPVFKDAYGTHIAFVRWYQAPSGETDQPPYVNLNSGGLNDPFDRQNRLRPAWSNRTNALNILRTLPTPAGAWIPAPFVDFDGRNKVMTVISAGPDKRFGPVFGGAAVDGDDDVYGFRLARFGANAN